MKTRRLKPTRAKPAPKLRRPIRHQTDDPTDDDEREVEIGGGDKPLPLLDGRSADPQRD